MKKDPGLTTADMVLLSLLAEQPMHGYQANAELQRREVRDWAGISRPQIYYSIEKLARLRMLQATTTKKPAAGPERAIFAITARGRATLADALERTDWCTQRQKPAFLTWMALSWQVRKGVFAQQLNKREGFLQRELQRERATLDSVLEEVGHAHHEAVWMLKLMIAQFETELHWLANVRRETKHRAAAKHPALVAS
jgi:DNA-binding PadR family transcriptional regulator